MNTETSNYLLVSVLVEVHTRAPTGTNKSRVEICSICYKHRSRQASAPTTRRLDDHFLEKVGAFSLQFC